MIASTPSSPVHPRRRTLYWMIIAAGLLSLLEIFSFIYAVRQPHLFDQSDAALAGLTQDEFERYRSVYARPVVGWDNPSDQTVSGKTCTGLPIDVVYGAARDRAHARAQHAEILIAGDSFTHGDDVADNESFPAVLANILNVTTANLGVGGYDPIQALTKLEASAGHFPKARIAVLSIIDDNVLRLTNSYRPVLAGGSHFTFKPHWRDGKFHDLPPGTVNDFATAQSAAAAAFRTDYWRRAVARFPYTVAVANMVSLPSFWVPQAIEIGKRLGYERMAVLVAIPTFRDGLRAVYARFADFAKARNLVPVVAFIPVDPSDRTGGLAAIAAATPAARNAITFANVTISRPADYYPIAGCHPLQEGYRMIAESVADALRPHLE